MNCSFGTGYEYILEATIEVRPIYAADVMEVVTIQRWERQVSPSSPPSLSEQWERQGFFLSRCPSLALSPSLAISLWLSLSLFLSTYIFICMYVYIFIYIYTYLYVYVYTTLNPHPKT